MRMSSVDTPKIIHDNVRHAKERNEKDSRILGLESNRNHNTCKKSDRAKCKPSYTPRSTSEDTAEEKEDEQDPSGELKVSSIRRIWV
jgi:hypothetical protein